MTLFATRIMPLRAGLLLGLINIALYAAPAMAAAAAGGFFHWKDLTMDVDMNVNVDSGDDRPWTYYFEPTELHGGVGCNSPNHINDLDLAKHICDRYDECHWFDGDDDFGKYPGAMGRYKHNPEWETFVKKKWKVVQGSLYFPDTKYLNIGNADIWCNKYEEARGLSIAAMKSKCAGARAGCDGFSIKTDGSEGFFCKWMKDARQD